MRKLTVINFSNKEAKRQLPVYIRGADMEQVISVSLGNQFYKILILEAHVHLGKSNSETALLLFFNVCSVAFW